MILVIQFIILEGGELMGEGGKEGVKKDKRKNLKVPAMVLIKLKRLAAYRMQSMKDVLEKLIDDEIEQVRCWEKEKLI